MPVKKIRTEKFFIAIFSIVGVLLFSSSISASTIGGTVFDSFRNPLAEVDVELQDDLYRQIDRTRTDGAGRYQFGNLSDGNYTVKVMPFRFDLIDQSKYIEINTINVRGGQGNTYINEDFYLLPKRGSLADSELGVVFAQEVPKDAESVYKQAIKDLSKARKEEGITGLREAIKIFPTYYLALTQLGKELFMKGEFDAAAPILLKSVEVYDKNPTTLYYLGTSLHKLNYNKPAIIALKQAHILAPASTQVLYVLGKAERSEGKFTEAEKDLLAAKKLSKVSIPDIHWELAQLYGLNLKRYQEAADELEQYLKSGKFDEEHTKKIKKLINDFQEKAKTQTAKS